METRRDFLRKTAGSTLALCLPAVARGAAPELVEWRNRQSDMAYHRLGRTDFMVSRVAMGGNEIRPDNYEHVLLALDMGLNYLDTSPAYGRGLSEQAYAKVIKARKRDQFFLTSKISVWDNNRRALYQKIFESLPAPEQKKLRGRVAGEIERRGVAQPEYLVDYFEAQRDELEGAILASVMEKEYGRQIDRGKNYRELILKSVDESLARLETDYLDIVMCPHGASSPEELSNYPEIGEAFESLKKAGKVRHLGVSSHSDPAGVLGAAVKMKIYSVAMVAYNVVNHRFVDAALAEARANDVGVIAMKVARPVHPGPNRGPAKPGRLETLDELIPGKRWNVPQRAYLWGLRNQNLAAVISNMVNADHVNDNLPLPLVRERK